MYKRQVESGDDRLGSDVAAAGAGAADDAGQAEFFDSVFERADSTVRGKRSPGRPKGATNYTTRQLAKYLKEKGKDPLPALSALIDMGPKRMVGEFGLKPNEAMSAWQSAAKMLLDKLYPQAVLNQMVVDASGANGPIMVNFGEYARGDHGSGDDGPVIEKSDANQYLADIAHE